MEWKSRQRERLIVNADDYGYSPAVNAAIVELLEQRRVSSTTILANMASEQDLQKIRTFSGQTGIHLNYIEGMPLSPPDRIRSLVDEHGKFMGSKRLLKRIFSGKVSRKEVATETQAQLDRLYQHNIHITHADSHQHVHIFPLVSDAILKQLASNGIYKVRYPFPSDSSTPRMRALKLFCRISKGNFKSFSSPELLLTDFSTSAEPEYSRVYHSLQGLEGVSEWMCHPSKENDKSYLNKRSEYLFLKSDAWAHILRACNIRLINYSEF